MDVHIGEVSVADELRDYVERSFRRSRPRRGSTFELDFADERARRRS